MDRYLTTHIGNEFRIEAERIYEPENNIDEINVSLAEMNGIELNFDELNECNKIMIYEKATEL